MSGNEAASPPYGEEAQGRYPGNVHRVRLFMGLIGLGLANGLNLNLIPLMNGAFIGELQLDTSQAGMLVSIEILAAAAVSILLSARIHLLAPRFAGIVSSVLMLVGMLCLGHFSQPTMLFAAAAIVGLSLGVLTACSAAAITAANRVDRMAAVVTVGVTVMVAALTLPLSSAAEAGGRRALFGTVAVVIGVSILLIAMLPRRRASTGQDRSLLLIDSIFSPVVFASICLQVGTVGIWAFSERIGANLGVSTQGMGEILAGSTLLSILGGVIAAVIARPGRERDWAILGVLVFGGSTAAVAVSPNSTIFVWAMYAQAFGFVFTTPFIVAVAISQDRSGGLAAAATGWSTLIGAAAPTLAGWMVGAGHYSNLAILALAATLLALGALALTDRNLESARAG
ncbi:putative MFS family arabinose efflux permease [Bradyrhizobium sp. USDA 4341]